MPHFLPVIVTPTARLTSRRALYYTEGADPVLDRPAFIRGGSSLAWIGGRIALVQDDANFLALIDPRTGGAIGLTLPSGKGGFRQFDDLRGNKKHRMDLEACVAVERDGRTILMAFGSGSSRKRDSVLIVEGFEAALPLVTLVEAAPFYRSLRAATDFCGSGLNLEGALQSGDRLRLFSRGNGAPAEGLLPVNAACSVDLEELIGHLLHPDSVDPPRLTDIARYELGDLGGVPLGFTDAMRWENGVLYTAAAEASPDAIRDGPVFGSSIGTIEADGSTRWAPITDALGEIVPAKAEGLVADPDSSSRLYVVLDADDPAAPSELCTVEIAGFGRQH